jgi:nucleoside-diphosphate-sugar epimerase
MNVLLTSATGYIGSAVAAALQASGHHVIGIARSEASAQRLKALGIQAYRGDLSDAASLRQAAQIADAVIHTAATNDANMATLDRLAVETILAALDGTQKPFVYTSGIWVIGDTAGQIADETTPLKPSPIVAWRPAVEEVVLAAAQRGVRSVVIRPALVYGQGGGLVAMLIQAGRDNGAVPVVGDGRNLWPLIHVEDLAKLYVKAMEQAPAGTMLIGASGEHLPLQEVALAAAQAAGLEDRLQFLTLDEARQTWGLLADALALDQQVNSDRARHLVNWVPEAPSVLEEVSKGSYRHAIAA